MMGVQLDKLRQKRDLGRSARRVAIDALQLQNYIDEGRKRPAVKNAKQIIKNLERLLQNLKSF